MTLTPTQSTSAVLRLTAIVLLAAVLAACSPPSTTVPPEPTATPTSTLEPTATLTATPMPPTSTPTPDPEPQVRYVLADAQLGGVIEYYRARQDEPAAAEAVRRWDAGVRVVNPCQFERKQVGGAWQVVYAGTEKAIDGRDVLLTTDDVAAEPCPAAAGRIVFEIEGFLYVMNPDGSGLTQLTSGPKPGGDFVPAWSPDGTKIAFVSNREDDWGEVDVWTMNAGGGQPARLTDLGGANWPDWSPDGTRIVFSYKHDFRDELWVVNSDGSGLARLTENLQAIGDVEPAWSPDGTKIAFRSSRSGDYELYVVNADGSGLTRLTYNSSGGVNPAWSPDGTRIAFTSWSQGMLQAGIDVINADGSGQRRLRHVEGCGDDHPTWSPDGTKIAFHSVCNGAWGVYVVDAAGGEAVRINDLFGAAQPDWSWAGAAAPPAPDPEARIRYILADAQLGGVIEFYRARTGDSVVAEAVRRWDAGVRVVNDCQFERKLVGGNWQVVYAGGERTIDGMDVLLSTDPGAGSPCAAPASPTPLPPTATPVPPAATPSPMRLWIEAVDGCTITVNGVLNNVQGPWSWNWGDGTEGVGWFPQTHMYAASGTYTVRVSSPDGSIFNTIDVTAACAGGYDEGQVRYILADAQLGGVIDYYRGYLEQPAVAEAVRRWDAGVRVANIDRFERKIVGTSWQVVYAGTETTIDPMDVRLTSDPPG